MSGYGVSNLAQLDLEKMKRVGQNFVRFIIGWTKRWQVLISPD